MREHCKSTENPPQAANEASNLARDTEFTHNALAATTTASGVVNPTSMYGNYSAHWLDERIYIKNEEMRLYWRYYRSHTHTVCMATSVTSMKPCRLLVVYSDLVRRNIWRDWWLEVQCRCVTYVTRRGPFSICSMDVYLLRSCTDISLLKEIKKSWFVQLLPLEVLYSYFSPICSKLISPKPYAILSIPFKTNQDRLAYCNLQMDGIA